MYRSYEDPYKLEEMLREAQDRLAESCDSYGEMDIDLLLEVDELKARINYAWQDDEYDHDNYDYADEMWMWENCYNAEEV